MDELVMHSNLKFYKILDKHVRKGNKDFIVHHASKNTSTAILDFLLEQDKNLLHRRYPQIKKSFPIHIAASVSNIGALDLLIKKGADLDCKDSVRMKIVDIVSMETPLCTWLLLMTTQGLLTDWLRVAPP